MRLLGVSNRGQVLLVGQFSKPVLLLGAAIFALASLTGCGNSCEDAKNSNLPLFEKRLKVAEECGY
jgi:hypothetical protein